MNRRKLICFCQWNAIYKYRNVYQSIYVNEIETPWISDTDSLNEKNMENTHHTHIYYILYSWCRLSSSTSTHSKYYIYKCARYHTTTYIYILCCTILRIEEEEEEKNYMQKWRQISKQPKLWPNQSKKYLLTIYVINDVFFSHSVKTKMKTITMYMCWLMRKQQLHCFVIEKKGQQEQQQQNYQ